MDFNGDDIDAITAKGYWRRFGVTISADALFQRRQATADRRPQTHDRRRTDDGRCDGIGLFWGYVGMVEGLVHCMSAELAGSDESPCRDGRLASVIAPGRRSFTVEPDLTLHGENRGNEPVDFCREIESTSARKTATTSCLRTAFDLVSGWAAKGIPLKIAFRASIATSNATTKRTAAAAVPHRLRDADVPTFSTSGAA